MEDESNKNIKKITSVLSIIFIGAVGSGFWDLFLKDMLFFIIDNLFFLINLINNRFIDNIYSRVGSGNELVSIFPSLVIMLGIIGFLFTVLFIYKQIQHRERSSYSVDAMANKIINNKHLSIIVVYIPLMVLILLYSHLAISSFFSYKASSYIDRSIEIIRPYISNAEYYNLRSQYRLINNRKRLEKTLNTLLEISEKESILLPKIRFIGVKSNQKEFLEQ